jgi:hypothetical protein
MITSYYPPMGAQEMARQMEDEKAAWHFAGLRVLKGIPITVYFTSGVRAGTIIDIDNGYVFMATTWGKVAIKISGIAAVEVDEPVAQAVSEAAAQKTMR